jgi:hypothetical protein
MKPDTIPRREDDRDDGAKALPSRLHESLLPLRRVTFAVAAAVALVLPARAPAQQTARLDTFRIHGHVLAADGTPIRTAEVHVVGTALTTRTDSAGAFSIVFPNNGMRRLRLVVARLGFRGLTLTPGDLRAPVEVVLKPQEVDLTALENQDPGEVRYRTVGYSVTVIHVASP